MSAKQVLVNGARLAIDDLGAGEAILLLHAGIADRRMWRPQHGWSVRFRLVIPDLRGYGESELPAGEFSNHADLVELLDALDIESVILVGVSMGGEIALNFALEAPIRVRGLVISNSLAALDGPSDELRTTWAEVDRLMEANDLDGANELELRYWVDGPSRTANQVGPEFRAFVSEMNRRILDRALDPITAEVVELELDPPARERLGELSVPVLVIDSDLDCPEVHVSCRNLADRIPGARSEMVANASHLPSLERPAEFNAVVEAFFAGIE